MPTSTAHIPQMTVVTTGWVDWYNARRLHSTIGDVPPDEFQAAYHADQKRHLTWRGVI
nr:integrase core domain-containing protein [Leifsonia sp. Leaf325]